MKQFNRSALYTAGKLFVSATALGLVTPVLAQQQSDDDIGLQEVIVTANKRSQDIQDVAAAVTAVTGSDIRDLSLGKMEDLVLLAPSVSYKGQGQGGKAEIVMRGVSDGGDGNLGGAGPSAAVYLDNQPITTTRSSPDLHAYDLKRMEVLNGPQGTLYGASSQSGTIKLITNDANPDAFEAGMDVSYANISQGSEDEKYEGFINIPLMDGKAALRIVGWDVNYGGYIDNTLGSLEYARGRFTLRPGEPDIVGTNADHVAKDFNESGSTGGRAKFLYNFDSGWTLGLSAAFQDSERQGYWGVDPDKGELETTVFTLPTGSSQLTQYALDIEGSVGFADLLISYGHMERSLTEHRDFSIPATSTRSVLACENSLVSSSTGYNYYGSDCGDPGGYLFNNDGEYERDTLEIRLSSTGTGPWQYIAGVYAEQFTNDYQALGYMPGKLPQYDFDYHSPGAIFESLNYRTDEQQALFGELSYAWGDLVATVGLRHFWSETDIDITTFPTRSFYVDQQSSGPFDTSYMSDENGETLTKINLSYRIDDNMLVYATRSEGYRPGGPNREEDPAIPVQYNADILTAMELGFKSQWQDDRLRFNVALFEMDWDDFQSATFDVDLSPRGYTDNVGNARIRGAEFDINWRPTPRLFVVASAAKYDAEITQPFALSSSIVTDKGSRLPRSPDYKASLRVSYYLKQTVADWRPYVRLVTMYNGEEAIELDTIDNQNAAGGHTKSYTMTHFTLGAKRDNWSAKLLVRNLFDQRTQNFISFNDFEFGYAPRSIGLEVAYRY